MARSSDFIMRRFLGEHQNPASEDSSSEQRGEPMLNPSLPDMPGTGLETVEGGPDSGNPLWCGRAREEHQLRQLRPSHLPPMDGADSAESLVRTGRPSSEQAGSDDLMMTACEMDRQTSIERFRPLDALGFLEESGMAKPREPEYYNMGCRRQCELWRL